MKKTLKKRKYRQKLVRTRSHIWAIMLPLSIAFLIFVITGQLHPLWAIIVFCITFIFTFIISRHYAKEMGGILTYLRKEALGLEDTEFLSFFKRRPDASRIVQTFNEIKNAWSKKTSQLEAQTLSDAATLEHLPIPLLMLDENKIVVQANLAAFQLFSLTMIGKPVLKVVPSPKLRQALQDLSSKKEPVRDIVFTDKHKLTFRAIVEKLPAPTQSGACFVLMLHDISSLKQFEETQRAFFINASHELKTPLSVLLGLVETLRGTAQKDPVAQQKFLYMMHGQITYMTQLVQDLLTLSRVEQHIGKAQKVSINRVLLSICQKLKLRAKQEGKPLQISIPHTHIFMKAVTLDISHLFENLIDNAIKYGEPNNPVEITLTQGTNYTFVLEVKNKGLIARKHLKRLGERFYRLPEHSHISGTGLGLSIAQEIAHKYQGTFTIASSAKQGVVCRLVLPRLR